MHTKIKQLDEIYNYTDAPTQYVEVNDTLHVTVRWAGYRIAPLFVCSILPAHWTIGILLLLMAWPKNGE